MMSRFCFGFAFMPPVLIDRAPVTVGATVGATRNPVEHGVCEKTLTVGATVEQLLLSGFRVFLGSQFRVAFKDVAACFAALLLVVENRLLQ